MKRSLCCVIACFGIAVTDVQSQSADPTSALRPHPVTVIIHAIPWLLKDGHPTYFVTVRGYGQTTQEARTEALRAAVDQAVGSVINSEREVENSQLRRSEVVQYASGYVDRYEVKQIRQENGLVAMTVDVWVKRSRLQDRLLGEHPTPGRIDPDRLQAQTETINHSRQQGDRLLVQILNDYPARAFDIEVGRTRITHDENRKQRLEVQWKMRWRHSYLESLREALSNVSQNPNAGDCIGTYARNCNHVGYVTIKARPGKHGWSRTAGFDDNLTMGLVRQHLIDSHPALLITLTGRLGQQIYRGCYRYGELENIPEGVVPNDRVTQPTHNGVLVNGWMVIEGSAPFTVTPAMMDVDSARIDIVRRNQCPN